MYIIRKRFHFSAAHRLSSPELTEEENREEFGPCANPHYHGHNYRLEVAVAGEIDPRTGMVINFDALKKIVEDTVISALDHKNLDMDVDFLKGKISTAENMARAIWERLESRLKTAKLFEIVLAETDDNIVIYRGD